MDNKLAIVTVAFREPYLTHSQNQILAISSQVDKVIWHHDELPTKGGILKENIVSHFQKSMYGFKPHAVQEAIDLGYDYVVWLDPSVMPTCNMNVLFDFLKVYPIVVRPGEESILKMCNQKAKDYFGLTDEDIKNEKHIAGTVYGFNFTNPQAVEVFNLWKKAEEDGIFGGQGEFMEGHWADEACLSLVMVKCGVPKYWDSNFTYRNQKN